MIANTSSMTKQAVEAVRRPRIVDCRYQENQKAQPQQKQQQLPSPIILVLTRLVRL